MPTPLSFILPGALSLLLPGMPARAQQPSRDRIRDGFDRLDRDRPSPEARGRSGMEASFSALEFDGASGMAGSAVSALDGLSQAGAGAIDALERDEARLAKLSGELSDLQSTKERKLADFREGLFCSGCDRTRTEILARNETFPHPGQHSVRLSEAELQKREAALQAPIDRLASEIAALREKIRHTQDMLAEVLEQLEAGHRFWCTAITHRRNLVLQELEGRLQTVKEEEKRADLQLSAARAAQLRALGPEHAAEKRKADAALKEAQALLKTLADRRRSHRDSARQRLARDRRTRDEQESRIAGFLGRGKLHTRTSLDPRYVIQNATAGHPQLGGSFHLGRLNCKEPSLPEFLPEVDRLIERFHQTGVGTLTEADLSAASR
ncbi:MAG: hypothetical protein HYZ13_05325 [Acidobacteria bacterium]|nr:hypothetical protein [Acidobacteriota bacterium]